MSTKVERKAGKITAGLIIALTLAVALKPAPAHAFVFDAVGAVLNVASGLVAGNPNQPTEAEKAERAESRSLAESVFGLERDAGSKTVAGAVADPKLVRAVESKLAR